MSDDFDFTKGKKDSGVEASLDDFFQPSEVELGTKKKAQEPAIEKARATQIKEEPDLELVSEEETKPKEAKAKKAKPKKEPSPKAEGKSKTAIILVVALILIVVMAGLAGAGYYLYSKLFKTTEIIAQKPTTKPKPQVQTPATEKPPEAQQKPLSQKPEAQTKESPATQITTKPLPETKQTTPQPKPTAQPTSTTAPAQPKPTTDILSTKPQGLGWACQVGAYLMPESIKEVERQLRNYGYQNLYNIDTQRSLTVHHLYLVGNFDKPTADAKIRALEQAGFKPSLQPSGTQYRVKVYSYGKKSIAQESKTKLESKGLGPAEIITKTELATLHQLRIGPYPTKTEATKIINELKTKGFNPVLVEEK